MSKPTRVLQITSKGSYFITIPKDLVEALGWSKGSKLNFILVEGGIQIDPSVEK